MYIIYFRAGLQPSHKPLNYIFQRKIALHKCYFVIRVKNNQLLIKFLTIMLFMLIVIRIWFIKLMKYIRIFTTILYNYKKYFSTQYNVIKM